MWSADLVKRIAAAVDADLQRQAGVQRGAHYLPAHYNDAGIAGADMNIVVIEVARAALAAIADASYGEQENAQR